MLLTYIFNKMNFISKKKKKTFSPQKISRWLISHNKFTNKQTEAILKKFCHTTAASSQPRQNPQSACQSPFEAFVLMQYDEWCECDCQPSICHAFSDAISKKKAEKKQSAAQAGTTRPPPPLIRTPGGPRPMSAHGTPAARGREAPR